MGAVKREADNIRARRAEAEVERLRAEESTLREALADLCGLRDTISDDVTAFVVGRHPETKEWMVWHEEYPEEGSIPLRATPPPRAPACSTCDDLGTVINLRSQHPCTACASAPTKGEP